MTTKNFSAIKLPHPKCSLELGCFDLNQNDLNLSIWIPRFSDFAHVIEVRKTGTTLPGQFSSYANELIAGSHIVIDNARPDLFFRRDFITRFVDSGKIHLVQNFEQTGGSATNGSFDETSLNHYQIFTKNNVLSIILTEKQYRRFGLIGKSLPHKRGGPKFYRIDVDLKDERIKTSNKFQDKLVQTFHRLGPVSKLYFRFVPKKSSATINIKPNTDDDDDDKPLPDIDDCLKFFKYVINEYAIDGCQPVPLTGCSKISPKPNKRWMNCSQLHPPLDLSAILKGRQKPTKDGINKQPLLAPQKPSASSNNNNKKTGIKRMKVKAGETGGDLAAAGKAQQQQDSASLAVEYMQQSAEELGKIVNITDWLGYQLLSLDCDREEISSRYPTNQERLDVSCAQICGVMDFELIHDNLGKIFKTSFSSPLPLTTATTTMTPGETTTIVGNNKDSQQEGDCRDVVLRALILYEGEHQSDLANSTSVVLLQDCTASKSREQQLPELESQQQVVVAEQIGLRKRQQRQPHQDLRQQERELRQRQLREELIVTVKSKLVQM